MYLTGLAIDLNNTGDRAWYLTVAIDLIVLGLLSEVVYTTLICLLGLDEGDTTSKKEVERWNEWKREKEILKTMGEKEKRRKKEWRNLKKQYKIQLGRDYEADQD